MVFDISDVKCHKAFENFEWVDVRGLTKAIIKYPDGVVEER